MTWTWRIVFPWDSAEAEFARQALAGLGLYPACEIDVEGDPGRWEQLDSNHRAALHEIVDELTPTDREAIYRIARLLAIVPGE